MPEREGAGAGAGEGSDSCSFVDQARWVRPGHSLSRPRTGNRWTLRRPRWGWDVRRPLSGHEEVHGGMRKTGFCVPRPGSPEALSWVSGCFGTRQSTDSCGCVLKIA